MIEALSHIVMNAKTMTIERRQRHNTTRISKIKITQKDCERMTFG